MTRSAVSCGFDDVYWRNPWKKTSFFVQCKGFIHNVPKWSDAIWKSCSICFIDLSNITLMHHAENKTAPSHAYTTNFSLKLKKSNYRFSIRGPLLWNNFLTAAEKNPRKFSKIPACYKGKTSFNDKWNKLFLNRKH